MVKVATITAAFSRTENRLQRPWAGRHQQQRPDGVERRERNQPFRIGKTEPVRAPALKFPKLLQVADLIGRRGDRARADCGRHQKTGQHDQTGHHHLLQESLQRFSHVAQAQGRRSWPPFGPAGNNRRWSRKRRHPWLATDEASKTPAAGRNGPTSRRSKAATIARPSRSASQIRTRTQRSATGPRGIIETARRSDSDRRPVQGPRRSPPAGVCPSP